MLILLSMVNINIEIDDELYADFQIKCIKNKVKKYEQVKQLIKEYVKE